MSASTLEEAKKRFEELKNRIQQHVGGMKELDMTIEAVKLGSTSGVSYDEETASLVMSFGSVSSSVGVAGTEQPQCVFPSAVARQRGGSRILAGIEAMHCAELEFDVSWPINHRGQISNWADFEQLVQHAFSSLAVLPDQKPVLIVEFPFATAEDREKLCALMFGKFRVPALSIVPAPELAVFGCGRETALCVQFDDAACIASPVYKGVLLSDAVRCLDLGGRNVVDFLIALLGEKGKSLTRDDAVKLTESVAEVSLSFEESAVVEDKTHVLPDGSSLSIGKERFRCTEALFLPSLIGIKEEGVHVTAYNALMHCPPEVRIDLYFNTIINGESSLFKGLESRMEREMFALAPASWRVKIIAQPHDERKIASWIGASIQACMSNFQRWITHEEFEQHGAKFVHTRCPSGTSSISNAWTY